MKSVEFLRKFVQWLCSKGTSKLLVGLGMFRKDVRVEGANSPPSFSDSIGFPRLEVLNLESNHIGSIEGGNLVTLSKLPK